VDRADKISGLTEKEYQAGLKLAKLTKNRAWPAFLDFCEIEIEGLKEAVFNNAEDQLAATLNRGRGMGIRELLDSLKTRTTQALAQEERQANSVEGKEDQ
jgi:N-acetylglucosamine-6-phosphate deacetylase